MRSEDERRGLPLLRSTAGTAVRSGRRRKAREAREALREQLHEVDRHWEETRRTFIRRKDNGQDVEPKRVAFITHDRAKRFERANALYLAERDDIERKLQRLQKR